MAMLEQTRGGQPIRHERPPVLAIGCTSGW